MKKLGFANLSVGLALGVVLISAPAHDNSWALLFSVFVLFTNLYFGVAAIFAPRD